MSKIIVGISGWKGSGKDTAADYLVKEHGYQRLAFADVLKEMVADQYGIPVAWCHDNSMKEVGLPDLPVDSADKFTNMIHKFMVKEFANIEGKDGLFWTPRALCILLGSVNRSVRTDYWVKRVLDLAMASDGDKFVISDLRYKSELLQMADFKEIGFVSCRINRFAQSPSDDPSERDLDGVGHDYGVSNKGNINSLNWKMEDIARAVRSEFGVE